jgi:hypothetical protein
MSTDISNVPFLVVMKTVCVAASGTEPGLQERAVSVMASHRLHRNRTRAEAGLSSFILARSLSACNRFMLPLARFA